MRQTDDAAAKLDAAASHDKTDSTTPAGLVRGLRFTETALVEEFAKDTLFGKYRWSKPLGWLVWDGRRWARCPDELVIETARQWARNHVDQAALDVRAGRDDDGSAVTSWLAVAKTAGKLASIVRLARGVDGVITDPAAFDAFPDLLNAAIGVVDLTTGTLLPHDPNLLLTRTTKATYRPGATHADWDAALQAIPDDIREWLQLRYGQAASGHMVPDDRVIIQHGGGENGKTTVTAGICGALGDYYLLLSDRVLLANPGDHPTELMDLRGVRPGMIEETPEARRLNVQRLKKVVGTPQITARHIGKDSVTFDATHSLFVSTNYRPTIEEVDHATWRRLALVAFPFRYRKPDEPLSGPLDRRGDPSLRQRVEQSPTGQHEAALAWLVAGAAKWYANERIMPEPPSRVVDETRRWRKDSDVLLAYLDDHLVFDPAAHVLATDLQTHLNTWLRQRNHREWSDKLVASRLGDHDELRAHHVEKQRVWASTTGLSRPPVDPMMPIQHAVPKQYTAWSGIRFRTTEDDQKNGDHQRRLNPRERPKQARNRRLCRVCRVHP